MLIQRPRSLDPMAQICTDTKAQICTDPKAQICTDTKAQICTDPKAQICTDTKAQVCTIQRLVRRYKGRICTDVGHYTYYTCNTF